MFIYRYVSKCFRIAEITKSLESLDDILDNYTDAKSLVGTESKLEGTEDDTYKDMYDDAFSLQVNKGRIYIVNIGPEKIIF